MSIFGRIRVSQGKGRRRRSSEFPKRGNPHPGLEVESPSRRSRPAPGLSASRAPFHISKKLIHKISASPAADQRLYPDLMRSRKTHYSLCLSRLKTRWKQASFFNLASPGLVHKRLWKSFCKPIYINDSCLPEEEVPGTAIPPNIWALQLIVPSLSFHLLSCGPDSYVQPVD